MDYYVNSDKTWVFDQSERAQGSIYILILGIELELACNGGSKFYIT